MAGHSCWLGRNCSSVFSRSLQGSVRRGLYANHGFQRRCQASLPSRSFSGWQPSTRQRADLSANASRGALKELQEMQKAAADTGPTVETLEWESPLRIIEYPDPRLRAANARIGRFDGTLQQFARDMLEAMYSASDGVGLAAPQVGVNVRLMVFNPTGKRGEEEFVLINPKVIHSNKRKDIEEEGCLSFPGIYADVERPTQIKIRAQDLAGKRMEVAFEGWEARIFQHEFDHLQGVLFHDRMSQRELSKVKSKLVNLEEKFQRREPDVKIQRVG